MERIVPSTINISISRVENDASLGETGLSQMEQFVKKRDEDNNTIRGEDGQTMMTIENNM